MGLHFTIITFFNVMKDMVIVDNPPNHVRASLPTAQFSHSTFPGQTVKQFTNTYTRIDAFTFTDNGSYFCKCQGSGTVLMTIEKLL